MFGMRCLKTGRKVFAGLFGDAMVFKLGGAAHAAALKLKGGAVRPAAMARPMKEWVVAPAAHVKKWSDLDARARDRGPLTSTGSFSGIPFPPA